MSSNQITKDMSIMDIVNNHPETADVFVKHGMHCLGCVAARFENLKQGCEAHGIDADELLKDLNSAIKKN